MKSLMILLDVVLQDCSTYCGTTTNRDISYISMRVKHEGLSFLTITLGDFATDFERSLELGHIEASSFRSFGKRGAIPKLFSGMLLQVFDLRGKLLDKPSTSAIFCIRQVCRMFKKILLPCTKERESAAVDGYIELETKLACIDPARDSPELYKLFSVVSRILWSATLGDITEVISSDSHIPMHGTGATALKVLPNQKYVWEEWNQRLEPYFPSDSHCYYNCEGLMNEGSKLAYLSPEQERPVRVVFVPKTLKSPRIIGIEPACMQYTQQSLLPLIVDRLESRYPSKGHVNFSRQDINASLALSSSLDGKFATLDLSEASDRVLSSVVYDMLGGIPLVRDAIFACRSQRATLPNGVTLPLVKFASMGSAMCFPIESMVFYTILICSELIRLNLSPSTKNIHLVGRSLYIYGDDIIIPTDAVPSAVDKLHSFGLKVNSNKSFSKGNFRESCGMDAYAGINVTPVYIRRLPPNSRRDLRAILSYVELSNQLHSRGFFRSSKYIENFLLHDLKLDIPYARDSASYCAFLRDEQSPTVHRMCDKLHRPLVKAYVARALNQVDVIDGYPGLTKWFLKGLSPDKKTYLRSVGSGSLAVKRQWCVVR